MRKGQMVRITWSDIVTELSAEELSDPITAIAIGVVHEQDKKAVKLKSGWYVKDKEWPAKDGITILKGCIDKVEILEVRK